ncbi:MAG: hypothetical protein Q8L21_03275 [Candidatus Komeilibacteria bacterium]|nr:hypothetical protein [Candidatus Komeilibacteria bacterium]
MSPETEGNPMEAIAAAEAANKAAEAELAAKKKASFEGLAQLGGVSVETVQKWADKERAAEAPAKPAAETAEQAKKEDNLQGIADLAGVDKETVRAAGNKQ